jgi:hypothetical protein
LAALFRELREHVRENHRRRIELILPVNIFLRGDDALNETGYVLIAVRPHAPQIF